MSCVLSAKKLLGPTYRADFCSTFDVAEATATKRCLPLENRDWLENGVTGIATKDLLCTCLKPFGLTLRYVKGNILNGNQAASNYPFKLLQTPSRQRGISYGNYGFWVLLTHGQVLRRLLSFQDWIQTESVKPRGSIHFRPFWGVVQGLKPKMKMWSGPSSRPCSHGSWPFHSGQRRCLKEAEPAEPSLP